MLEQVITSRERDLGGFTVRRILPYMSRRMVGPFIFFDHMGPAEFPPGQGIDVRPHPHINLATVTYLFRGRIQHRDSLGSDRVIEPGAINWMTAGRGIVHSERTPADTRKFGGPLDGIQCWVAVPEEAEETEPSFDHHPADSLPDFEQDGARVRLLLGTLFNQKSPVKVHSDIFYAETFLKPGASLRVPGGEREAAAYVVEGKVEIAGQEIEHCHMAIAKAGAYLEIRAKEEARVMLLGGKPLGRRYIFWNFVSSSKERLEQAKHEWRPGPRTESARFLPIPGDDQEFIPLPEEPKKGTIM